MSPPLVVADYRGEAKPRQLPKPRHLTIDSLTIGNHLPSILAGIGVSSAAARASLTTMLSPISASQTVALSVMQSITDDQSRREMERAGGNPDQAPTVEPATTSKTQKALADYYFGDHMSVTEALTKMFLSTVDYLNDKLEVGRDRKPESVIEGNAWRKRFLSKEIKVNSADDFSLAIPADDPASFGKVARTIRDMFNIDDLSRDSKLIKRLENAIGYDLGALSVADLVKSFADPTGSEAAKVRRIMGEILAGQTGSKVMQRLQAAEAGGVEEAEARLTSAEKNMNVVDEETKAEKEEDRRIARAKDTLEAVSEEQDALADAEKELRKTGTDKPDGSDDTSAKLATDLIVTLAAGIETAPASKSEETKDADTSLVDDTPDDKDELGLKDLDADRSAEKDKVDGETERDGSTALISAIGMLYSSYAEDFMPGLGPEPFSIYA